MKNAEYWIKKLELEKHSEGGWFRQVYASEEEIKKEHLPERFSGARKHATSIYFLLTSDSFSALHRIKSDETWHFYDGADITIHIIEEGSYCAQKLGKTAEVFQFTVAHGAWFGASVDEADSYALVGCSVAPGFDYNDFEMGKRDELLKMYPEHKKIIEELTG